MAVSAQLDLHQLAAEIKLSGRGLGFDRVGIAPAAASHYRDYFRQWLDEGRAGEMGWLHKRFEERTDPATYLPGAGKPIELEAMPAEENARLVWWALKLLRQNDFIPEEVRWHKALDRLREALNSVDDEAELTKLVGQINELVHKINTLGTNALKTPAVAVDLEEQKKRLRARRDAVRWR